MPSALKIVRRFGRKPTQADCEGHEKTNRIGEIYIETIRLTAELNQHPLGMHPLSLSEGSAQKFVIQV